MVLTYEKHPEEVDWTNNVELFSKLYRIVKFESNKGITILSKHNLSKVTDNKEVRTNKTIIQWVPNTLKIIKVKVNTLGKIVRI